MSVVLGLMLFAEYTKLDELESYFGENAEVRKRMQLWWPNPQFGSFHRMGRMAISPCDDIAARSFFCRRVSFGGGGGCTSFRRGTRTRNRTASGANIQISGSQRCDQSPSALTTPRSNSNACCNTAESRAREYTRNVGKLNSGALGTRCITPLSR